VRERPLPIFPDNAVRAHHNRLRGPARARG
jgi:hypothetical protein